MTATDVSAVTFKIASEDWEFEEIHRLNYQTFVEEIPQHPSNSAHRLVDHFNDENTYIIAIREKRLIGMLAVRDRRPFSLDRKLPNLNQYLPATEHPCEVRLLATNIDSRNGLVFRGLVDVLVRLATENKYDLMLISGTVRQEKLYHHLGFTPFGPVVGTGDALYQPMYLTQHAFDEHGKVFQRRAKLVRRQNAAPLHFLPGPVTVHTNVRSAFMEPAVSHRSVSFVRDFRETQQELCRLANACHVDIMMGSGTLANDAIAAELSLWKTPGLILSNGAFGERLIDHAKRFGLLFKTFEIPWGRAFDWCEIERRLDGQPSIRWIWMVHGETSTGVLNDLNRLKRVSSERGIRLAVDAVSSLGTTYVDLSGIALASSVSGKGLGAYTGLALVFRDAAPGGSIPTLPRYLDLGFYSENGGIPFTISSPLLYALKTAIGRINGENHFADVRRLAAVLHDGLRRMGLSPLATSDVFPAVTTIEMPLGRDSLQVGQSLEDAGILLHYRSEYLSARNWLQICLMGICTPLMIDELLEALSEVLGSSE